MRRRQLVARAWAVHEFLADYIGRRSIPGRGCTRSKRITKPQPGWGSTTEVLELELHHPRIARLVHAPHAAVEVHPRIARLVHAPHAAVEVHFAKLQTSARALVQRAKRAKVLPVDVTAEDVCGLLLGAHAAAVDARDPISAARKYADGVP